MDTNTEHMGIPPDPLGTPKRPSGFRIFLYVLAGLGVALVLTCGGVVWWVARDPAMRDVIDAAMEAQSAPGAEELRAAGCSDALVMDLEAAVKMVADQAPEQAIEDLDIPKVIVHCQREAEVGLDCDAVARTYLETVGPRGDRFLVQVNEPGFAAQPSCRVVYAGDGTRLGTLEELEARDEG